MTMKSRTRKSPTIVALLTLVIFSVTATLKARKILVYTPFPESHGIYNYPLIMYYQWFGYHRGNS
ncbi:MAG: hypothetical protein JWP37_3092 [Mucilaginibacter sp.]|nr:hypothetical protein [Mucilaginibacter sp.]